jgi:hypothetical protein
LLVAGLSGDLQHATFFGDFRVSAVAAVSGQIVVHHVAHLVERRCLEENLRLLFEKARGDVDDEGLVAHLLVAHHFREDIADARVIPGGDGMIYETERDLIARAQA